MAGINAAFSELTAFTFRHQFKEVTSSLLAINALLKEIEAAGNVKRTVSGGTHISAGVILRENTTRTGYSGYQPFNIEANENGTVVEVPWIDQVFTVTAHGPELRRNSGGAALKSLVELRIQAAKETDDNATNVEMYGDGAVSGTMYGLQYWITTNGQGSPGGIDSALFPRWRNQFLEAPGTNTYQSTPLAMRTAMTTLRNSCTFGEEPNLWILSSDFHEAYEQSVQQQMQYWGDEAPGGGKAQGTRTSLYHGKAKVVRDITTNFGATAERGYCLNTKDWVLFEHPEAKGEAEKARVPANQDAVIIPFLRMRNLICKQRRTQGVLIDAA